ncbi:signal peptidase I [Naasia lichenicola]|nr:signal peptidase I [Naasia lichenicola]
MHALRALLEAVSMVTILVCAAVILAPLFGFHLVHLATGSMSPSLPTDSLVIARDVDASTVNVGDIVTVQRADGQAITHRVLTTGQTDSGWQFTLKGDANQSADPAAYDVSRVGLVTFGIPFGGQVIDFVRTPGGTAVLSIIVSSLIFWTIWPTSSRRRRDEDEADALADSAAREASTLMSNRASGTI